jgi:signal transduction histidine kinase
VAVELQLGSVPAVIEGDADQIRQVLVNLLLNAAQAMHGQGFLQIVLSDQVDSCQLLIRDNGPGVPDELHDKIFEPFFSTKERGAGTGLGLSICRRLVEDHGGQLTVSSQPGKGATFALELPRRHTEKVFDNPQ